MLRKIVYCVLAAHLALVSFIAVSLRQKPQQKPPAMVVKTYTLPPPAPPKTIAQPRAKPKKPVRQKARDVMQDLQKNIANIEKKKAVQKPVPAKAKPQSLPVKPQCSLEQDHPVKPQYSVLLIQKLKSALHLPEEGDVKLTVTLKNSGEVIDVKVLSSKSPDNATYLQAEIPKMRFPVFSGELIGKKQHTFTMTFCHDP